MDDAANPRDAPTAEVVLTRRELSIIIGGVTEALYALGDNEFATRVGPTGDEARTLVARLVAIRKPLGRPSPK